MVLTDKAVKAAKPREKAYKLFDEKGLFLHVVPPKGRWWRFKYTFNRREKLLSLGTYPDVSLKKARERRDEARTLVADGVDPSAQRQATKVAGADTFKAIALAWLDSRRKKLKPGTIDLLKGRLEGHIFGRLGSKPIGQITADDLLFVLRKIESKGNYETAHRARSLCSRIFRYAIPGRQGLHDVAAEVRDSLAPVAGKHFAAITEPAKVGALLRAIDGYSGQPAVNAALKLAPLTFVRPGELRGAEWSEFDVDAAEWRIPAHRMKAGREHLVPLSRQAIAVIEELRPLTGYGRYLFPALSTNTRPISENTVNGALRRMGYAKDEMTGHGFRSIASTLLNERGFAPDIIELQLAHGERDKTRAAYNKAQRIDDRRKMMQAWADYLDTLRRGDKSKKGAHE